MTQNDQWKCFFVRNPDAVKIEQVLQLIRQYQYEKKHYADEHKVLEIEDGLEMRFKNPSDQFRKEVKHLYDMELEPCGPPTPGYSS